RLQAKTTHERLYMHALTESSTLRSKESERSPTSSLSSWLQLACAKLATIRVGGSDEGANAKGWTRASTVCATPRFRSSRMLGCPMRLLWRLSGTRARP